MSKILFDIDPAQNAAEATLTVLRTLRDAVVANEPGVRADRGPECLHDFRVAMRRTRSALSQMKRVFPPFCVDPFKQGFRWMGRETGPQRDADVLLDALPAYERELRTTNEFAPLSAVLRERRRRAHERTLEALDSPTYAGLMERWQRFLSDSLPDGNGAPDALRPVRDVASERITRAYARVLRVGEPLTAESPAVAFHELRIGCKKLRYLVSFFRGLYAADDVAGIVPALKTLQDALGTYNDCDVQRDLMRESTALLVAAGAGSDAIAAVDLLMALLGARQEAVRAHFEDWFAVFSGEDERRRFDSVFSPADGE